MKAKDVKVFYNWLYTTHQKSIKTLSALHTYWHHLKMLYKHYNKCEIDSFMAEDALNVSLPGCTDMSKANSCKVYQLARQEKVEVMSVAKRSANWESG